jgi:mono/diheme cytochrome c family protein
MIPVHLTSGTMAFLVGLVFGMMLLLLPHSFRETVSAQERSSGDPERGRQVFHGRGICHYCHGQNGDPEFLPELRPETLRTIRGLRPQPPDLRRPEALRLKTDKQRFVIIRDGHEGTGMLPDSTLSNQEIRDVVAYLATLRDTTRQTGK